MTAIIELKKYVSITCIICIIIRKFYYGQNFDVVILLLIDKNLEMNLYYIIGFSSLTIYLKNKAVEEYLFNVKKVSLK